MSRASARTGKKGGVDNHRINYFIFKILPQFLPPMLIIVIIHYISLYKTTAITQL